MQRLMAPLDPSEDLVRKNLKKFREEAELSRAQLSELSDVPEKNIIRYETGETGIPSGVLTKLAPVFGRKPGDFYEADPPPPPPLSELPVIFFKLRPGAQVPENVLTAVRKAIADANDQLRKPKSKK
jgi:transcriptional regulator with XRE-family HTH domain